MMENIEQLFTVSFALGAFMIAIVYGFYAFQTKQKSFRNWHLYWCLLTLANIGLLLSLAYGHTFGNYIYTYAAAIGTYFFVLGSYAYIGRSPQKGIHLFMSVFLIFLLTLTLFKSTLLFVPLVLLLLVISYFSIAGIAFIHEKSRQRKLFGIAIFFACRQSDHLSLVLGNRIL